MVQFGEMCMNSLTQIRKALGPGRFILRMVFSLSVLFFLVAHAQAQVAINTTALPVGNTSNSYYVQLAATGGQAPYSWQLIGSLPTGLSLSSAGVISGLATQVTTGTPPLPTSFTVQVTDSLFVTATQTFSITILPPGSHSLVINQIYTGGGAGSVANPSPYASDYLEIFNAAPVAVDLQNWTLQFGNSGSAFANSGVVPIGSLDPYQVGSSGGPNNDGNFPAFTITYSSAFTASNCNPVSTSAQLNPAFPASHCWLNPGQYMLVITAGPVGGLNTGVKSIPLLPADLVLATTTNTTGSTFVTTTNNNSGPVSSTSATNTGYVGHGGSAVKPGASGGMIALVNGVGIGVTCQPVPPGNPKSSAVFSPLASDFVAFYDQVSAGSTTLNTCWNGSSFPMGGTSAYFKTITILGGAIDVEGSGKNNNALIRSAGNGKLNATVQNSLTYPSGVLLPTSGVTLTPCGDTGNNFTDWAPIVNGMNLGSVKGQANWVLHNSSALTTPTIEASYASTPLTPTPYTPTSCPNLNPLGPTVTASFSQPNVAQGAGGGTVTETLTVKVTPASQPTSEIFNVNVNLSGIPGATPSTPITAASIGVPDGLGNLQYQEQFSIPTTSETTYTVPITVMDDAYRPAINANSSNPLDVAVNVGAACQAPVSSSQTLQIGWNTPQPITLSGQVGTNCTSSDTLVYAIQNQPQSGVVSAVSGNSLTYTPNAGFTGMDSFTYNVTDTTNSAGALISTPATVNLVVSATGVVPSLNLNCPAAVYTGSSHACTAAPTPFVAGTTSIAYNGSATLPVTAGTYPVVASFVSSYYPSENTSASATLVISQATPTFTVNCANGSWTGSPQGCTTNATGIAGVALSGTTGITYNGSTTPPTDPGTYAVVATFAPSDADYSSPTVNSSFTITEPVVTITVNSQTMVYGSAVPTLTYTVSPSIPLQIAPVCTSSATGTSAVGTYIGAISCSGATKIGCTFIYVAGNMTVQKAAATVAANNQTMTSGTTVPALTYATTPSGLPFTTAPACTTTATSASSAGTYPITCAGGVSANYNLSYTGGTMTVLVAPTIPNGMPTISGVSPMTVTAGSPNLALTVNGAGFVSGATVLLNGSARATTFVSSKQLTATILAADQVSVGTAEITVFNPAPGGGTTAAQTFSIDSVPQAQGGFTVSPTSSALTVTHGQSISASFAFTNLQPGAVVSGVCYNLPSFGSCSFNGKALTIITSANSQPGIYNVLVVFSTSGTLTARNNSAGATVLCGLFGFPLGLVILLRGRRLRLYSLGVISALLLMVAIGCGGNSTMQKTPVVSAQSSTAVTLTVQ